jgi:hypothetical protein
MNDDHEYVIEQQEKRFSVLEFIWKETRGQPSNCYLTDKQIGIATKIYGQDLSIVVDYLKCEGLIELREEMERLCIRVTHLGVLEMESAITNPNQDTNHFFSSVIINFIETMNQTNISAQRDAIGNISSSEVNAPVTNTVSYSENDTSEILQAIAELRQQIKELPQDDLQKVADIAIGELQEEISNPVNESKLKLRFMSVWNAFAQIKDPLTIANALFKLKENIEHSGIDLSSISFPKF